MKPVDPPPPTFRLGCLGIAVLAAASGGPAMAQSMMSSMSSMTSNSYVGASVGQTRAHVDERFFTSPFRTFTSDNKDTAYKIYGGWQFSRNLGLELGYHDLGRYGGTFTTTTGSLGERTRLRGAHLDLVGTWPVWNDKLSVIGRVGAAYTQARTEMTGTGGVAGPFVGSRTERGWGPKVGLGLEYAFTPTLAVRAEWERYRVRDALARRDDVDMASIGVVWHFGGGTRTAEAAHVAAPP
ncbi:outer membrane beta-barrel protein, partial [Ramlibacter sp.]